MSQGPDIPPHLPTLAEDTAARRLLSEIGTRMVLVGSIDCPYLKHQEATSEFFPVYTDVSAEAYHALMDLRFRRSGRNIYRPVCKQCRQCIQIRVPAESFTASRSQKRVWRRNADIRVEVGEPISTPEKHRLYASYLRTKHDGTMEDDQDSFENFLYDSPVPALEFRYFLGQRLVGVSIADHCPDVLSSVYMYFDPEFSARSLGTFSILAEIDHCRTHGLAYYYLGYWVPGSRTMDYKARFRPAEILEPHQGWITLTDEIAAQRVEETLRSQADAESRIAGP